MFKPVRVLSGGEKSRLALAKMLLQPANLLVLDEPTNHLDMRSKSVLQEALQHFEGSIVIVSHDRDFLDPLVTKVVEFKGGHVREFSGGIDDYLSARRQEEARLAASAPAGPVRASVTEKDRKRLEAELRQQRYRKTRPLRTKIETIEKSIEAQENRKSVLEHLMADPGFYKDGDHVKEVSAEYREIEHALRDAYFRWGELSRELERLMEGGT